MLCTILSTRLSPSGANLSVDNQKIKSMGWIKLLTNGLAYTELPWWLSGKEHACQGRRCRFDPWVGKISWRRKWQSIPVFLPGKSHGQRRLAGYSPWGRKRVGLSDRTTTTCILWIDRRTVSLSCTSTETYLPPFLTFPLELSSFNNISSLHELWHKTQIPLCL